MSSSRDEEFRAFVEARRAMLLRTSTALAGGDAHLAEDLVQRCLLRLYLAWPRVRSANLASYSRRALVNALIDERRSARRRREESRAELPELAGAEPAVRGGGDDALLVALGQLPPRMRAAVVLRHVEGLSTEETAAALRCRPGTVKSQTARGLAHLRAALEPDAPAADFLTATRGDTTPR